MLGWSLRGALRRGPEPLLGEKADPRGAEQEGLMDGDLTGCGQGAAGSKQAVVSGLVSAGLEGTPPREVLVMEEGDPGECFICPQSSPSAGIRDHAPGSLHLMNRALL